MEHEMIKVFDNEHNEIGVSTRHEVHRLGLWHEVFHCWLIAQQKERTYIYLQLRSPNKRDFPNLLDITSAGHLQACETVQDGVREVWKELGIEVSFNDLISLGTLRYSFIEGNFLDNEIANVFLYKTNHKLRDFNLQKNEVNGIFICDFNDFYKLWFDKTEQLQINGYVNNEDGEGILLNKYVNREDFVPHNLEFYQTIVKRIKDKIK